MNIHGFRCNLSQEMWLALLNDSFPEEELEGNKTHSYLYISAKGFQALAGTDNTEGLSKLTIDDIISITRTLFHQYHKESVENLRVLHRVFQKMDQGAEDSWWSMLIHWLRGLGFNTTHGLLTDASFTIEEIYKQKLYQELEKKQLEFNTAYTTYEDLARRTADQRFIDLENYFLTKNNVWLSACSDFYTLSLKQCQELETSQIDLLSEINERIFLCRMLLRIVGYKMNLKSAQEETIITNLYKIETDLNTFVEKLFSPIEVHDVIADQTTLYSIQDRLEALIAPENPPFTEKTDVSYPNALTCRIFQDQTEPSQLPSFKMSPFKPGHSPSVPSPYNHLKSYPKKTQTTYHRDDNDILELFKDI